MSEAGKDNKVTAEAKGSSKIKWIVGGILLLFATAVAMNLPRGYSDDLSRIGKGKAALVLVRDKFAVQSFDLQEVMNGIRDQYSGQVEFLLTDSDTPEGRAFITANNAARVTLVVLDANGKMVNVLHPPQTAESVQQALADALKVAPQKTLGRAPG
jgi:hypothetical protein